eukprot:scaffold264595_cov18-Prasinocladus_malaysianus.AAC.1
MARKPEGLLLFNHYKIGVSDNILAGISQSKSNPASCSMANVGRKEHIDFEEDKIDGTTKNDSIEAVDDICL